jgi:hypothetical protein
MDAMARRRPPKLAGGTPEGAVRIESLRIGDVASAVELATHVLGVKPGDRGEQFACDITDESRQMFVAKANGQVIAYGRVAEMAAEEAAPGTPAGCRGPVVPPQPPKTRITCRFGHVIKTRAAPGTCLPCPPCGQEGRKDVTVTVPPQLPAIRPEVRPDPAGLDIILRRKSDQERWHCGCCLGSTLAPAPGEPPLGWLEVVAGPPGRDGGDLPGGMLAVQAPGHPVRVGGHAPLEYEVPRLHLLPEFDRALADTVPGGRGVRCRLHPPPLRALGLRKKIAFPAWVIRPPFRLLRVMRHVRGTPADLFGYTAVRRTERRLAAGYEAEMRAALAGLSSATHATAVELARLPLAIRGYEQIKLAAVARYESERERLRTGGNT